MRELAPLPDTADELRAIGKVLGATPDAINLREAASETRVKAAPLKDYRVIQFATHGLVAGDLVRPGRAGAGADAAACGVGGGRRAADGVGNRSAEAQRRLGRAVCLQYGAGANEGAEALSGLARAFFYAGARALLVSHWAVYSQAATELTTTTFAALAATSEGWAGQKPFAAPCWR